MPSCTILCIIILPIDNWPNSDQTKQFFIQNTFSRWLIKQQLWATAEYPATIVPDSTLAHIFKEWDMCRNKLTQVAGILQLSCNCRYCDISVKRSVVLVKILHCKSFQIALTRRLMQFWKINFFKTSNLVVYTLVFLFFLLSSVTCGLCQNACSHWSMVMICSWHLPRWAIRVIPCGFSARSTCTPLFRSSYMWSSACLSVSLVIHMRESR